MSFAAVTTVDLKGRDPAEGEKLLREGLIPRIKGLSGFQSARFLRSQDGETGVGAVMFDTEGNAKAGLDVITKERPAEAPPVQNSAIYELVVEV